MGFRNQETFDISIKIFHLFSNILHYVVGVFLILIGIFLVYDTVIHIGRIFEVDNVLHVTVQVLDKILLVVMLLEIAHTVLISYQEHIIRPEPFLVVGIIASVRRILVLSITMVGLHSDDEIFRMAMTETVVLGVLILVLSASIVLLNRFSKGVALPAGEKGSGS